MGVPDAAISMVLVPDLARAKSLTAKLLSFSVLNIKSNFVSTKYLLIRFTCNSLGWTNIANALNALISDPNKANSQTVDTKEILKIIGLDNKQSPSTKAAEIIFSMGLEN